MKYSTHLTSTTSQTLPLPGFVQVKNNAGGFVFEVTKEQILERFLLIGSENGSFYVSEKTLTKDNAQNVISLIKEKGMYVANTALDSIATNRAPKVDAAIFVLSLCVVYGDTATRKTVYDNVATAFKTFTQLTLFLANLKDLKGWSAGLRRAVARWYTTKSDETLAYQVVKYRNRNGYSHRDVLRLCHAKATSPAQNEIFKYLVGKTEEVSNILLKGFELAQKTERASDLVKVIKEYNLTHEMVPNKYLNKPEVLSALLSRMPTTALMRNLNRFATSGLTVTNLADATIQIRDKLTNEDAIKKSGLHPVNVLNTLATYQSGNGFRGSTTWNANPEVIEALENTLDISYNNVKATNKRILIAVDVSGSMTSGNISNMNLTPQKVAAALSLSILKAEVQVELIWFDTNVYHPKITRKSSYSEVLKMTPNGGGTDCSLALTYALEKNLNVDAVIILTDSETWAGKSHAVEQLALYRSKINKDVKIIEIGMVANKSTNYLSTDTNVLQIAGFDATVPTLINNFIGANVEG